MESDEKTPVPWLDRPLSTWIPHINVEFALVVVILVLAAASRFYIVDLRVMSHDETNHVVPSYDLFRGRGYRHDPVTHGPMQFHLLALSYFIFGDSDLSSRIPSVVFSIATVAFVLFGYRRYLGRKGALIASVLFLISPYMLFYGRYTRNESFVALFGVALIYGVFRYLDRGDFKALLIVTLATVLHFITKETAFIYTAQYLLLTAFLFVDDVLRLRWPSPGGKNRFVVLALLAIFLIACAMAFGVWDSELSKLAAATTEAAAANAAPAAAAMSLQHILSIICVGAALVLALGALFFGVRGLGWKEIRAKRSFDLLMLVGTLILPQLAAFPLKMLGWDPLDYSSNGMLRTGIALGILGLISLVIGLWWNPRIWLVFAGVFYAIFTLFYTTFFTNGRGFFTGIIGSLGYWLSQQGVERGSQPWYYFALIQMPIYEYLAVLGTLVAAYFGLRYRKLATVPGYSPALQPEEAAGEVDYPSGDGLEEPQAGAQAVQSVEGAADVKEEAAEKPARLQRVPVLFCLLFWSITSLIAYSLAGEKMPWLTVHVTLGFLLSAGWGLGYLVETTPWKKIINNRGVLAVLLGPIFLGSLAGTLASLMGATPPFQGNTLDQLQSTSTFLVAVIAVAASGIGIFRLLNDWEPVHILRLVTVVFFVLAAVLTARTAARASYVNYDTALEFLVYAHAARGPKDVLAQIEEISYRTTKGKDLVVAYDNDGLYPYWWYLRDYPNKRFFTDKPTRDLRDAPIIVAGEGDFGKLEPIVRDNFVQFEYMRLWWPMQDYFDLTWDRVWSAIKDPRMRSALFQIWLNRDYAEYAKLTNNQSLTVENWQPSNKMRMYVRKDIVAEIWSYGTAPVVNEPAQQDPYIQKMTRLTPDLSTGTSGAEQGMFNAPRGLATAPDGAVYVADSRNNRIQEFTPDGKLIRAWGTFADAAKTPAAGGQFNEPWGVAVAPDGSAVYVTDTWNHRVQKFTSDGQFLKMWGYFGQGEKPEAFWGPRGIAVDSKGQVYIADTGNKRVVVFTSEGEFVAQFGEAGMEPGQLDEPVGLAVDLAGRVYVVDTWNQRVQVFAPDGSGKIFTSVENFAINGWFGQSLDNKPFIAVDQKMNIFVTDPEGYRVLEFASDGSFIRGWGDLGDAADTFGLPSGIAVDSTGRVWVSDSTNNRIQRFSMP